MEVSHFELIWKPQSPNAPQGTPAVDSVLQGYFLEITNLESVSYSYTVEFVAAAVTDPLRSLAGNTVVFVDTPGTNNSAGFLNGSINSTTFTPSTGRITIPAKGTALIAVLPSAFGVLPFEPTPLTAPNFEVRGYVRIRLPTVTKQVGGGGGLIGLQIVPQAAAPVKVMLTPQNRATYFSAAGAITDQTQASLPLAGGSALVELPPDQPFIFTPVLGNVSLSDTNFTERLLDSFGADGMMQAVTTVLATLAADGTDLASFNKSLAKLGVGLAVEKRSTKGKAD